MVGSIVGALARIKRDPLGALGCGAVEAVCDELGYAWRDRTLDPATTLALFVQQVRHGNCPCAEVRHLVAGTPFTPSAYCQARARLPLRVYQSIASCRPSYLRDFVVLPGSTPRHVDHEQPRDGAAAREERNGG